MKDNIVGENFFTINKRSYLSNTGNPSSRRITKYKQLESWGIKFSSGSLSPKLGNWHFIYTTQNKQVIMINLIYTHWIRRKIGINNKLNTTKLLTILRGKISICRTAWGGRKLNQTCTFFPHEDWIQITHGIQTVDHGKIQWDKSEPLQRRYADGGAPTVKTQYFSHSLPSTPRLAPPTHRRERDQSQEEPYHQSLPKVTTCSWQLWGRDRHPSAHLRPLKSSFPFGKMKIPRI